MEAEKHPLDLQRPEPEKKAVGTGSEGASAVAPLPGIFEKDLKSATGVV